MTNLQEGDVVLCTVEQIEGTTVFVKLPDNSQGAMIISEIAPGRIRNLRDYVMPNKKIVCKVLRISQNHIDLSLRRVSAKEKTEVMEKFKQEQTAKSAIRSLLKEKSTEVEEKITSEFGTLADFFIKAREDDKLISKYFNKDIAETIQKIVQKRKKNIEVKKTIKLKSLQPDGMKKIKDLLDNNDEKITITYIAAGNFQITIKDEDYKKANQKMQEFLDKIQSGAKKNFEEFCIEDKK